MAGELDKHQEFLESLTTHPQYTSRMYPHFEIITITMDTDLWFIYNSMVLAKLIASCVTCRFSILYAGPKVLIGFESPGDSLIFAMQYSSWAQIEEQLASCSSPNYQIVEAASNSMIE